LTNLTRDKIFKRTRIAMASLVAIAGLAATLPRTPATAYDPNGEVAGETADQVLWRGTHESGNHSEWDRITISGSADADVVSNISHSGKYANALKVSNGYGGVRMVVTDVGLTSRAEDPKNLPDKGYFSVWYYFPQKIEPSSNIFQWKQAWQTGSNSQTRRLLYWIRADWNDNDNAFNFHLKTKVNNNNDTWDGTSRSLKVSSRKVPLNTWVHLECSYKWSKSGNGRIVCWQDGNKIFEFDNLTTEFNWSYLRYPRQWTVNNYTGSYTTNPANHTIYIDDAAIATSRLGP
jgi:hypothetical protein